MDTLQEGLCGSACGLRRTGALLTPPAFSCRSVHPFNFHRRVLSSSWNPASSTLPTAGWVRIRLDQAVHLLFLAFCISRHTNLERHTSPVILSTHFSERRLQPLSKHPVSSTTSNTPCFSCAPFPLFVQRPTASGQSTCHQFPIFLQPLWRWSPSSVTGLAKCSSPTLIAPSEIIWRLMALNIATTTDAGYSDAASDFPVTWTCLRSCFHRPSPRRHQHSLELVSHLVCFLMNSSLSFGLRAFRLQRHVGQSILYTLGSLARD